MHFKNYPFAVFVLVFLCSCQQKMYFPERANTPGLTEAMEGKATISIKPNGNDMDSSDNKGSLLSPAVDLAFAPAPHFGIIASYRNTLNRYIEEDQNPILGNRTMGGIFNGHRFELGAGFFDQLGSRGKVEVYIGYGNGFLKRRGDKLPEYDYNTRYHRFFIQPAAGIGTDRLSFTGGFRFSIHKYYDFEGRNDPELKYYIAGNTNVENGYFPFIEPFANVELGYTYVKFNIQVGMGTQLSDNNRISGTLPFYVSFGLVGHYAPRFFKHGEK